MPYSPNALSGSAAPALNTVRAALLERERLLVEKLRIMREASYRHRLKIESELGDLRRKLNRLTSQTQRNGPRSPDRANLKLRNEVVGKGAAWPSVTVVSQPDITKTHQAGPRSGLGRLYDRLVAKCVVEKTAVRYSGMSSWKTAPCRLLLRLLAKSTVPEKQYRVT
jgi:hypothetical protein